MKDCVWIDHEIHLLILNYFVFYNTIVCRIWLPTLPNIWIKQGWIMSFFMDHCSKRNASCLEEIHPKKWRFEAVGRNFGFHTILRRWLNLLQGKERQNKHRLHSYSVLVIVYLFLFCLLMFFVKVSFLRNQNNLILLQHIVFR